MNHQAGRTAIDPARFAAILTALIEILDCERRKLAERAAITESGGNASPE